MRLPPTIAACLFAVALSACGAAPDADGDTARARSPGNTPAPDTRAPAPATPATPPATPAIVAPGYAGFGPAAFDSDAEAVCRAWGRPLDGAPPPAAPGEPEGCHYLVPEGARAPGTPPPLAFMIEAGRFVRVDVHDTALDAPGGGRVGMAGAEVERLHAGRVERQPYKYVEGGQVLRVRDPASGHVLAFETDAAGMVTSWRVGLTPQVDYVEGCS